MAKPVKPLSNKVNPEQAKVFVDRIEELQEDMASEKAVYMTRCKGIRASIKELYGDAKDNGLSPKPLKALIKIRAIERKASEVTQALDIDHLAEFEQLREALGDYASLPLGAAALEQARA